MDPKQESNQKAQNKAIVDAHRLLPSSADKKPAHSASSVFVDNFIKARQQINQPKQNQQSAAVPPKTNSNLSLDPIRRPIRTRSVRLTDSRKSPAFKLSIERPPVERPSKSTIKHQELSSQPLKGSMVEKPNPKPKKYKMVSWVRDLIGLAVFVLVVAVGAFLINSFIFRSFNVVGPSMMPTLEGGFDGEPNDRLIINLLPQTWARIQGKDWMPERGDIIVFRNPRWRSGDQDEYVVKRVIGLPGDRVTVKKCILKVYNDEHPDGFNPYKEFDNLNSRDSEMNQCVDGEGTDSVVEKGKIFVVGDHRYGNYSMDSRDGSGRATLGQIPLENVVGKVSVRIWPIDQFRFF